MPIYGGSVTVGVGSGNREGAEPGKTVLRGIAEDGTVSVFLAVGFRRICAQSRMTGKCGHRGLPILRVRFFHQLWVTPRIGASL